MNKWIYLLILALIVLLIGLFSNTLSVGSINEGQDVTIEEQEQELKDQQERLKKQDEKIKQLNKKLESKLLKQQLASKQALQASSNPTNKLLSVTSVKSSCAKYEPLLAKYNWDIGTALRIVNAESGCSPVGHNWTDTHRDYLTGQVLCYGSWGLFNIGCVHGYSRQYLENPENNVKVAYLIYKGSGGFYPWTTY